MPAPTVILTWQEKESSDEGQTVPLILFWFTDGSVCLSKAVGFDRLSLLITTILRGLPRAHYRPACIVRWGFQKGEAEALPFGRPRGFQPRGRYKWIKFTGSAGKGNADGPTSFLAMNYETSKVAAG